MALSESLSTEEKAQMQQMAEADSVPLEESAPQEKVQQEPAPQSEPVTEQAPSEEKKPEAETAAEKPQRLVPLSELQEERKERRAAQERLDAILAKISSPAEQPALKKEAPNPDQDPLGALKATAEEVKELRKFRDQQEIHARNSQAVNQVMQRAIQQETEFLKEAPDYNDAGNFLRNMRVNQLKAVGYDAMAANNIVIQESLDLANRTLANGGIVPKAIYELAKSSGYVKKTAPASGEAQQASPETSEDRIARIAAGQKANVSLTNASGVQQKTGSLDARAIIAMDDKKFDEFLSKLSKSERMAVMGN